MFNSETKERYNKWTKEEVDALQNLTEYHPHQSGTSKSKWYAQLAILHNQEYCKAKDYKRTGGQIKYGLSKCSNTTSKCSNSTTNHYDNNKLETNSNISTTNSIPSFNDDQSRSSTAAIPKPTFIPSIPNANRGSLSSIRSYSCSYDFSRGCLQFPYTNAYTNRSSLSSLQSHQQSSTMGFSQSIDGNVMIENNINFEYRKR